MGLPRRPCSFLFLTAVVVCCSLFLVVEAQRNLRGSCPMLSPRLEWFGNNRERINDMLKFYNSDTSCSRKVAAFDWDNTVIKNDMGDGTIFWMLQHGKIPQPANQDWSLTNKFLTPEAAEALSAACGKDVPAGAPLPTETNEMCAEEILSVYLDNQTSDGMEAFFRSKMNSRRYRPSYAWSAQLFGGLTRSQITKYATEARQQLLDTPQGVTFKIGRREVVAWIRYYEQQVDLITQLTRAGIEVWIISASSDTIAKVWAAPLGIPESRVVGVRSLWAGEKQTYLLEGCGSVADGSDEMVTFVEGKRCWVNKAIFEVDGKEAEEIQTDPCKRVVFAAGDANTDVDLVGDSKALRLVLNRNFPELMCRAYDNEDGRWLINPMFIDPKPKLEAGFYNCSTNAFVSSDWTEGPVKRPDGSVIPDQEDTVF